MRDRLARALGNVRAVAYKEARLLRHDRAIVATVVVQPVLMFVLYAFGLSNRPTDVPWVVLDRSQTAASRRFVQAVRTSGHFLPPRPVASEAAARAALGGEGAVAALVVPIDFARASERRRPDAPPEVQLLLDGSDPLTAARIGAAVARVALAFDAADAPGREHDPRAAPGPIDVRQRFWFNATLRDRDFFLAGLAGMLLTNLCLAATSGGLVREREDGTWEQVLALPTRPLEIVLGKLVPHVGLAFVVFGLALLLPGLVFGSWPRGSFPALVVVTLPFVLASLAIGVLVSTLARTQAQAVFITIFFIMPSFILSGAMLPYGLMPPAIRDVGVVLPLRWYQIAQRLTVERGAGFAEIAGPALALLAIFAALLLLVRARMKPRLG